MTTIKTGCKINPTHHWPLGGSPVREWTHCPNFLFSIRGFNQINFGDTFYKRDFLRRALWKKRVRRRFTVLAYENWHFFGILSGIQSLNIGLFIFKIQKSFLLIYQSNLEFVICVICELKKSEIFINQDLLYSFHVDQFVATK